MLSNLKAKQIGLILVLVPVLIELTVVALIAKELLDAGKEFQRLHHLKTTLLQIHKLQDACIQTFYILSNKSKYGFADRRYVLDKLLSNFEKPYQFGELNFQQTPELKDLLADSEGLRQMAVALGRTPVVHEGRSNVSRSQNRIHNETLMQIAMEQQRLSKEVIHIETSMVKHEPEEFSSARIRFLFLMLFGFLLNVIISFFLLRVFIGNLRNRLNYVTDRGQMLALGQPLSNALEGADELSEVDRVITDASDALAEMKWTASAVLDNSADLICSLDEKMRFSNVGASSARFWGHEADELERKSVLTLVSSDTTEFTRASFEKIRADGEGKFENLVVAKHGAELIDALWTVTWSAENGSFYCVVNNVTEMRNVDRLKKRFMAMASHDIRSPLNSINLVLTSLTEGKRGEVPEKVLREFHRAGANSQRLLSLVNDFLELEKFEASKFSLDLSPIAASEICDVAKESLAGMSNSAGVTVISPKTDAIILGDERRLVQVLINLLSNAIKFSPADSTIRLLVESDKTTATIKIVDQGPGIAVEDQQFIFDKFSQTRAISQVKIKGTGLGLAIVKNIVEAHGGRVGVTSELNAGSTFWFTVPLFEDDEADMP